METYWFIVLILIICVGVTALLMGIIIVATTLVGGGHRFWGWALIVLMVSILIFGAPALGILITGLV